MMTSEKFLESYGHAWETRDPEQAAQLFAPDASYYEDPFDPPIVGRDAIRAYWKGATDQQRDIQFSVHRSYEEGETLIAEWSATYTHIPARQRRQLRGVLIAEFQNEEVKTFREYWQRRLLR